MQIMYALAILCVCTQIAYANEKVPKIIWTYWHSKDLPIVVRECVGTWKKAMPGWDVRMVHEHNVGEFLIEGIDFPKQTWQEEKKQTQSDMIRFALVRKYGGMWLDATTILRRNVLAEQMDEKDEWFACSSFKREIFAFASIPNGFVVSKMHAQLYNIIKQGRENRAHYLKTKYNITNLYHFPQLILDLEERTCTFGTCVTSTFGTCVTTIAPYTLLYELRKTKVVRYKNELFHELFTRTNAIPEHVLDQPLLKLNYYPANTNNALPNSWWSQLMKSSKQQNQKVLFVDKRRLNSSSDVPFNVTKYIYTHKNGNHTILNSPAHPGVWPIYVFNRDEDVQRWTTMKKKIPWAIRIPIEDDYAKSGRTKYHFRAWQMAIKNGAPRGAIFLQDDLIFLKNWRGWLARMLSEMDLQVVRFDGLPYHKYNTTTGLHIHNASIAVYQKLGGYYLTKKMINRALTRPTKFPLDFIIRSEAEFLNVSVFTSTPRLAIQKWYAKNLVYNVTGNIASFNFHLKEMADMQKLLYLPVYGAMYNFEMDDDWHDSMCTSGYGNLPGHEYKLKFDTHKIPWNIMQFEKFNIPKADAIFKTPSVPGTWKSYVINLDKDVDKWKRMQHVLPNAIRVPAYTNISVVRPLRSTQSHQNWASHVDAWQMALKDGCAQGATFFEDDMIMMKNWRGWLSRVLEKPNVHVVRFDAVPFHKRLTKDGLALHASTFAGTGGYYMTEAAIKKALSRIQTKIAASENGTIETAESILTTSQLGMKVYTTTPRLGIQDWFRPSQYCKKVGDTVKFSFNKRSMGEYLQLVYLPKYRELYDFF